MRKLIIALIPIICFLSCSNKGIKSACVLRTEWHFKVTKKFQDLGIIRSMQIEALWRKDTTLFWKLEDSFLSKKGVVESELDSMSFYYDLCTNN